LKDAPIRQIDVGKVSYTAPDKTTQIRYFDNIASFGLSGAADHYIDNSSLGKYFGGTLLFLWATIKTVFTHPNQTIRYRIDDGQQEEICSRLCLLANGRYFGGGMHAAPFTAVSSEHVILDIDGESPGFLEATFEILPKVLKLQV